MAINISSEIALRGKDWDALINGLHGHAFETIYQIFIMCASIGIMKDELKEIVINDDEKDLVKTIARTVLIRNQDDLDFLFSTAIITSKTIDLTIEERLRLAFGEKETSFKQLKFLEGFANVGLYELLPVLSNNDLELLENLKEYFEELETHDFLEDIEIDLADL